MRLRRSSPPDARVRVCVPCGSLNGAVGQPGYSHRTANGNGFDASAKEQIRAAWKGEPGKLIL